LGNLLSGIRAGGSRPSPEIRKFLNGVRPCVADNGCHFVSCGAMKSDAVNWTSTKVPLWESDCVQFWRTGQPFELRDVTSDEHHLFIARFSLAHELEVTRDGDRVIFNPKLS
jgi:hypothetical protein